MRDSQFWLIHDPVVIEQDIDIDGAVVVNR
jgi:hypothetical protein